MSYRKITAYLKKYHIEYIDLRFTDTRGKEQHMTVTPETITPDFLENGKSFDGSSIVAWKQIESSDMLLIPDINSLKLDIFRKRPTAMLKCTVFDPKTHKPYEFCPRATAIKAEQYLKQLNIADKALLGPETEFFIFDSVSFETNTHQCHYTIESEEGMWNTSQNPGYHQALKSGYCPIPPVDAYTDLRAEICAALKQLGLSVEVHHHEVGSAGQGEIVTTCDTLTEKADQLQLIKYAAQSVAQIHDKTLTFMPKPLNDDNGSGLHVHLSLTKSQKNIFSGDGYAGLSKTAHYCIGGILKHGKALSAFTNASVNSYRRLIPGFEAPIYLAYSAENRSAAIRIPHSTPENVRIEIRFPDATMNPYLAFSAILMAAIDGIQNQIDPGDATEINLYEASASHKHFPALTDSLESALQHLSNDHDFLLAGDVFTQEQIMRYITLKTEEVIKAKACTHPIEFQMYYDL